MHHVHQRLKTVLACSTIFIATARAETVLPPAPVASRSFDAGSLHVDQFGKGEHALILIPGLAGGSWVWNQVIAKLSPSYSLYVITLPGFDGRPAAKEES